MSVVNKGQSKHKLFIVRVHWVVFLLKRWFRVSKLKLNNAKAQVILVFLKRIISEGLLEPVRLLGFWLDSRLDGNCHVAQKFSRVIHIWRKFAQAVPADHLLNMYHALFHSHVAYGVILWGHASACTDILLLQKRAIRILALAYRLQHCKPLFKNLKIVTVFLKLFTVFNQYIFNTLNFIEQNFYFFELRSHSSTSNPIRC